MSHLLCFELVWSRIYFDITEIFVTGKFKIVENLSARALNSDLSSMFGKWEVQPIWNLQKKVFNFKKNV